MADITNLFKATVKTVRLREKAFGTAGNAAADKSILPSQKPKSEFYTYAKDVVSTISKLRDFLLEHRKDYINANGYLGAETSKMTETDRDRIDTDAEVFIKTCCEAIKQLKSQAHAHKVLRQVKEHKDAVLELTEKYLTGVCHLYSEQRAVRVKRIVDRKCLSRLETQARRTAQLTPKPMPKPTQEPKVEPPVDGSRQQRVNEKTHEAPVSPSKNLEFMNAGGEEETSAEEAQMLQMENEQLYEEMSSMVDEVKQIEGKIVEISRLQEIFSEKVLEQEKDIDHISDTVVGTTENIKEANEEIREAMKNNAGFRVWILFFLIVCSLSLLFLDWYNA